jgi:hypothetical protein
MIRGTSTTILNKLAESPLDLLNNVKNSTLADDARRIMAPPGSFDCLMLTTPTKKMHKSPKTFIFFVFLFTTIQAMEIINVYPHLSKT